MLRANVRTTCHVRWCAASSSCSATAFCGGSEPLAAVQGSRSTVAAFAPSLNEQRRFSFKYATKRQHNEVRQPYFIHEKRYGLFSNEHNIAKPRRGLPHITPIYTKHMNLWETDTDASNNRFFRSYVFGQRELHLLLGRPHAFEANEAGGRQGDSVYEENTDLRYKGVPRPAIANLHYEPMWNQTLYRSNAHGNQLANPSSALTEAVLGTELLEVRDIKSVEHCKAWFDRLQFLIQKHYDAVGDIGEYSSRHTRHVHEFFVAFHDAVSSFDFQDRYLLDQFTKVRPTALEDLFAIFLEMEANYVNEAYCPRCSLPFATTHYCGEGDPNTPFRKHRGRWAPHQQWGKEWYDVVMRRAEALWYRATEDPYFGSPEHTQRQVEALLNVYVKTKQRAKAIDFLLSIRGSKEFLLGRISITAPMQAAVDSLLDTTPHQHLLTNSFEQDSRAAKYTGESQKVPQSPMQMRLDLEMNKFRRQQREEGVVKVPPALWKPDTSAIVPYTIDPRTKRVTNWRAVKEGIEKSFCSTGLPKEAYTSLEWREMLYLKDQIESRGARRAQHEAERRTEEAAMQKRHSSISSTSSSLHKNAWHVFPDKSWYRVFDITDAALKPFGVTKVGQTLLITSKAYRNPAAVPYTDPVSGEAMMLDTTAAACHLYGGYESGDVLQVTPLADGASPYDVVVVGVNKSGAEQTWALCAMYRDNALATERGLLSLGTDCFNIKSAFAAVEPTGEMATVSVLDSQRSASDEQLGHVVGVRQGLLHVQWSLQPGGSSQLDRSVAVPLGNPSQVKQWYRIKTLDASDSGPVGSSTAGVVEPSSWRTPFRNAFLEERLKEVEQAPFQREQWASLVKGKYTPKVKRFGYTQHITQDDFQTKEYKDRLLARQFFNNPQAFEVIPERRERSVAFRGKWEHQRVCGLPTVDREELEKGWGEVAPVSDAEVEVIEQALRDISGRRPGNFHKSPTETQALRLNESWWTPHAFGWEEHNKEQIAFLDRSEQHIIESSRLPFKGKRPPFDTTYGIGERISEIAADYAKGFGLGPHGHSPGSNAAHFNTLGAETQRVQTLGLGNPLVRLFNEKLGSQDIHLWAAEQCGQSDANARHLLLSVKEWRTQGRRPSMMLCRVLQRYLGDEVAAFNIGLPADVPRLVISHDMTEDTGEKVSDGNIWSDVDRRAYAFEHAAAYHKGDSDEAYIVGLVMRACMSNSGLSASDSNSTQYIQQDTLRRFQTELTGIVGKDIPSAVIADRSAKANRGSERSSGNIVTLVRSKLLAKLLAKMGVTTDSISAVLRGLSQCPEKELLDGAADFAVPVALIYSWGGPQSPASSTVSVAGGGNGNSGPSSSSKSAASQSIQQLMGRGRGIGGDAGGDGEKMVVHALEDMAWRQDGVATDLFYAIRQNKANKVLRREFFNAFLSVHNNDHKKVAQLYSDYSDGKYVPNVTVAIEAFIKFLATISRQPEQLSSDVPYFHEDDARQLDGTGGTRQYTQIQLLPPQQGPFQYESTLVESIETAEQFRKFGIVAGPTRAPLTGFIAANSSSLNYFTNRGKEVVHVTMDNDQGLLNALRKSAAYADISGNPKLRTILQTDVQQRCPLLIASFNRFFYRVAPMLHSYHALLQNYAADIPAVAAEVQYANHGLARALEMESSSTIEQEFRRNAERYWRGILDGRNIAEEANQNGGTGSRSGSAAARRPMQQGSGNTRGSGGGNAAQRSGGLNLSNIIGKRASASDARSGSASSAAPARPSNANRRDGGTGGGASSPSSSGRLSNLLGSLKGGGGGSSRPAGSGNTAPPNRRQGASPPPRQGGGSGGTRGGSSDRGRRGPR